ncbi:hypothetical protein Q8A67_002312 [Cirrhinus molitorella]|uniref:Secreted protein n=1 Tax=Cirrhinus molitorella TaxID=172907 RepID=A0AA88TWP9_9TELE|nr:hypothetical protein Q8A67_002312 [Cirrhinus molitorella]
MWESLGLISTGFCTAFAHCPFGSCTALLEMWRTRESNNSLVRDDGSQEFLDCGRIHNCVEFPFIWYQDQEAPE